MKKIFLPTLLIVTLLKVGFAQDFNTKKIDDYFNTLEKNNEFMGSIAVSQNGEIVYSKVVGFLDVENKVKADHKTKYRIGSITKTFTSVMVLKGVELGKIDLTQTIDKYFPAIKNSEKISIKHLLNHQSGIHNFTDDIYPFGWELHPKSKKEMLETISKAGNDFEPGSRTGYSNSNYILLTFILQESFKKTYKELLEELIVQPIGLENTYFGGKINTKNNESKSYKFANKWQVNAETDISIPLGAGGITSTSSDLVKFSDALFAGKLITPESLKAMKTFRDKLGLGLFKTPFYEIEGFGHAGDIDGFSAIFSYFPNENISYAWISNGKRIKRKNISNAVLGTILYNKSYNISTDVLDKYIGNYSSTETPLKITITRKNEILIAQATGQSPFPLKAMEKDVFKFEQGGIVIQFDQSEKSLIIKQGGKQYTFKKD